MASTGNVQAATGDYYNYTVSAGSGAGASIASTAGWSSNTISTTLPTIKIEGTAEIDGDITVQGRSMSNWMSAVDKRLAILVPDPEKLKQFEALQKAYQHYKMLEALCEMPVVEDDE